MSENNNFDWGKVVDYINTAGSVAGAAGATVGAAVQGYKDGRAGNAEGYRPINDVDVGVSVDEGTKNAILVVVVIVGVIIVLKAKLS